MRIVTYRRIIAQNFGFRLCKTGFLCYVLELTATAVESAALIWGVGMIDMMSLRWVRRVFFAAILCLAAGCTASLYEDTENWAAEGNDSPEFFAEYDIFFLYPSLTNNSPGKYWNWMADGMSEEIRREVAQPLGKEFGQKVRIFSPFVPQLNRECYYKLLNEARERKWDVDWSQTPLSAAIEHATDALKYYMAIKSKTQPLIIMGHEQGAVILYEAMKRCSNITPENGFVAAYFLGLPGITSERIRKDFGSRGIFPAKGTDEVGVIAVCNMRTPATDLKDTFALPGGAVINPINWRCDATPARQKDHIGAVFYNRKEMNPTRRIKVRPAFCGAVVDTENALVNLTNLPPDFRDARLKDGFDAQLQWVFGMCISKNARTRVRMYKFLSKGVPVPWEE